MDSTEAVAKFIENKEVIERYGFYIEVTRSAFKIKTKLEDGTTVLSAYLLDVSMLQGFLQGIECLITTDGPGRSKEISVLVENKHANDCKEIKKKGA